MLMNKWLNRKSWLKQFGTVAIWQRWMYETGKNFKEHHLPRRCSFFCWQNIELNYHTFLTASLQLTKLAIAARLGFGRFNDKRRWIRRSTRHKDAQCWKVNQSNSLYRKCESRHGDQKSDTHHHHWAFLLHIFTEVLCCELMTDWWVLCILHSYEQQQICDCNAGVLFVE